MEKSHDLKNISVSLESIKSSTWGDRRSRLWTGLSSSALHCSSSSSGHLKPVTLFDCGGIHVSLHFAASPPSHPDVALLVVSTVNTSALPVKDYLFQAAVPKVGPLSSHLLPSVVGVGWRVTVPLLQTMSVKLQPASGTQLSAYNPLLPPPAISQVLLLANPEEVSLSLHRWSSLRAPLGLRVAFHICPRLLSKVCVSATSWLWATETSSCTKAERSTASPAGRLWLAAERTFLHGTQSIAVEAPNVTFASIFLCCSGSVLASYFSVSSCSSCICRCCLPTAVAACLSSAARPAVPVKSISYLLM